MKQLITDTEFQVLEVRIRTPELHLQFKHLLLLFIVFSSFASLFSQTIQDSISRDSLDKAFIKQVNDNNKAAGLDTIVALPDSLYATQIVTDSSHKPKLHHAKVNTRMRHFYWNPEKANLDSLSRRKYRHSPLYATLFSMALPGLGQAYNRRYWKIPIVYAGFGGLGYAIYYTGSNYFGYRHAYRLQADENVNTYGSYKGVDDPATLKDYRDYFKKNLDISVICTAVWYVLNLVDAAVDAHLFEWNMKDDLNVSWQPTVITGTSTSPQATAGVRLSLHF